jgi:SulP family sulfate permease
VVVLRIRGSLYFASVQAFESQMPDVSRASGSSLILAVRDIDDLGSTAIRFIKRYAAALGRQGGRLVLCGVSPALRAQLDRTGLTAQLGEGAIFAERPEIGAALNDALAEARRTLPAT